MLKILKVFTRILDVIMADGEKRLKLAIENVIYVAFALVCAWGTYKLISYVSDSFSALKASCTAEGAGYIALAILGIISCVIAGVYALIAGIVSQAALLVFSLLGTIVSKSRSKNFIAFIIALISLGACALGALWLFGYFPIK